MKFLVLGAGLMGRAIALDLARSHPENEVLLTDIDEERAIAVAKTIAATVDGAKISSAKLDVAYYDDVVATMSGMDAMIGAVSYHHNYMLSKAAIEAGSHYLDLGGNNEVVERQMTLGPLAAKAGVLIVPNCGLAPGMACVLAAGGAKQFEQLDAIRIRVGGLPQHPRPPLNYELFFAPDGLINEYIEPAEIIHEGYRKQVESLTAIEEIVFAPPFGAMEAFNTSGGASTLTRMFEGRIKELDYKTIRYKGHCEKFKLLFDLGFASSEPIMIGDGVRTARELFTDLLRKKLTGDGRDVVLLRVTITGRTDSKNHSLAYEMIDYYDDGNQTSAMMRTTAFPTSIIAQMVVRKEIDARGVFPPEQCVPAGRLVQELKQRNVIIKESKT